MFRVATCRHVYHSSPHKISRMAKTKKAKTSESEPVERKLSTREVKAIQRSVEKKLEDLNELDLPLLQHFLAYLNTGGKEGFNPIKPEWTLYRNTLGYNKHPVNWSYDKFRGVAQKLAVFARLLDEQALTGKLCLCWLDNFTLFKSNCPF